MKNIILTLTCSFILSSGPLSAQSEKLIYHDIKTDNLGRIVPWYSNEPGKAYSFVIQAVWRFWDTIRTDMNGLPYYMNHQVWNPGVNDKRGIGGDQLQMALSSWRLLYQFTGDERIKENMKFIADYYLTHSLSPSNAIWPNIPFPYNTFIYSGYYDGDMVIGKNYTQPDKAGSFGYELINLYKMTGTMGHGQTVMANYIEAAINIANTLADHTLNGDENNSPLPFKVNAITGETGTLLSNSGNSSKSSLSTYTSNWVGTMELFLELVKLNKGKVELYKKAFDKLFAWMNAYPLKNNKWGPFFEDIPGWSDTQINAITYAQFIMNHQDLYPTWENDVVGIFDWVYKTLGNRSWEKYGVIVVNEQTAYQASGNSHTSRQASAELQYVFLSGDTSRKENAIRQLNWATYMVDIDGKNRYPRDENWLTDGYGDYVRHYLRAIAALPEIAPLDEEHILSSTSVIQQVEYKSSLDAVTDEGVISRPPLNIRLRYTAFDTKGLEMIHLLKKPSQVIVGRRTISEIDEPGKEGYVWKPQKRGGLLLINRQNGTNISIFD